MNAIEWLRPFDQTTGRPHRLTVRRINVVGTTGSGKTTFAGRLAADLSVPFVELDALHWGPNWTPVPTVEFRSRTESATLAGSWVIDGNYRKVRDLLRPRLQLLVWLDYRLTVIFWRLTRRCIYRVLYNEKLWESGNRESLRTMFCSRDSLYLWAIKSHGRNRKRYLATVTDPDYAHVATVRLRTPQAAEHWRRLFIAGQSGGSGAHVQ